MEYAELDNFEAPNPYQLTILLAMHRTGRHIYEGTVPQHVVARRRAANKRARRQRVLNAQR